MSRQKGRSIVLRSVVLQASARNLAALKFYEVCGYQRQGLLTGYYGRVHLLSFTYTDFKGRDAIPMRLFLTEGSGKSNSTGEEMARTPSGAKWVAVY